MKPSRAPLITAIVLLLFPVLYVGSYLALVDPYHTPRTVDELLLQPRLLPNGEYANYRWGGRGAATFFWPLEQIDRKLRPQAWAQPAVELTWPRRITRGEDGLERIGVDFD